MNRNRFLPALCLLLIFGVSLGKASNNDEKIRENFDKIVCDLFKENIDEQFEKVKLKIDYLNGKEEICIVVGEKHTSQAQKIFKNRLLKYVASKLNIKNLLLELNQKEYEFFLESKDTVSILKQHLKCANDLKMDVIPFDSDEHKRKTINPEMEDVFSPEREKDMLTNIMKVKGNKIIFLGELHPSYLKDKLTDQNVMYLHLLQEEDEKNKKALIEFKKSKYKNYVGERFAQYLEYLKDKEIIKLPIQVKLTEENVGKISILLNLKYIQKYEVDYTEE